MNKLTQIFCVLLLVFCSCTLPPVDNSPRFLGQEEYREISTISKAKDYARAGKLPKAELLLRRAVDRNPEFIIPLNDLGYLLYLEKRLIEAELTLKKVIRIEPKFVPAHLNLARVYIEDERFEEAIEEFNEIENILYTLTPRQYEIINKASLPPGFLPEILRYKASTYYLMGLYDEAICNSALAQKKLGSINEASVHTRLLLSLEHLSKAHEILRDALSVHQENLASGMMFDYALTLVALESNDTAKLVLDRILERSDVPLEEKNASRLLRYILEKNQDEAELLKESLLDGSSSLCSKKKFDSSGYWPHKAKELVFEAYNEICSEE